MTSKRALFIGRWQPFHKGHEWLINQKLKIDTPCLVAIRDIPPDEKNPLSSEQVKIILEKRYEDEDVLVTILPDIESVNWGRGVGYETLEHEPPTDVGWVSATKIREAHAVGDESWKEYVPSSVQDLVLKFLTQGS